MKSSATTFPPVPRRSLRIVHSALCIAFAALAAKAATVSRFVEYVETDGSGSTPGEYVLLDYVPTANSVVETDVAFLDLSQKHAVFCSRGDSGVNTFTLFYINDNGLRWDYNRSIGQYQGGITAGARCTIRCSNQGLWLNGTKSGSIVVSPQNYTPVSRMMLFAAYMASPPAVPSPSGVYAKMRLYSVKAWDDNGAALRVDLRPCVDSNGVAALYDVVSGTIYYNLNAGKSLVASTVEVERPETLKFAISGYPEGVGASSPAQGTTVAVMGGESVPVSASDVWTNASATAAASFAGWKLYDDSGAVVSNGEERAFTYVHPDPAAYRRLEWQWDASYKVTATAGANGSVSFEDGFYAAGSEILVTAVPDEGYAFAGWTGLPDGVASANPLRFTLGLETNGVALAARFALRNESYALDLSGGDQTIEVAAGCVHTVTSVTGNSSANLTVTGGGHLILPSSNLSSSFANLVIDGVLVQISAENQLGGGTVTFRNGGGILCTAGFTQSARKIIIEAGSTGVVEVAAGTVTFKPNLFSATSATLLKQGTDRLEMNGTFEVAKHGDLWIVDAGNIFLNGTFATGKASSIEIHETGLLLVGCGQNNNIVIGDVAMRGGQLRHTSPCGTSFANKNLLYMLPNDLRITTGKFTALPSRDGSHAYVSLGMLLSGGLNVFDIREGAILDLDSALRPAGRNFRSLRKTGGGTLRLLMAPYTYGGIEVAAGTLALAGRNVRIARDIPLRIADGARLVLEDGATLDQAPDISSPLLAEAAVWLDASQLRGGFVNGSGLACTPNRGTAGGVFELEPSAVGPVYRPTGLNGLPTIDNQYNSNGRGLKLVGAFSHTGSELSTYVVACGTANTLANGLYGKEGSPFSFGTTRGGSDAAGGFRYSYTARNAFTIYFSGSGSAMSVTDDDVSLAAGPFISATRRDATTASLWQYRGDASNDFMKAMSGTFPNYDIANMGLFFQVNNKDGQMRRDRTWLGQLSELLVFPRKLTDAEDEAVRGYLAKKWFASTREWAALPTNAPAVTFPVTVEAGDTAALNFDKDASSPPFAVAKLGAGALDDFSAAPGGRTLDVREGRAAFTPATNFHCPAALWFDAADSGALSTNAAGAVLSVRNKGWAGGEFLPRDDTGARTCAPGTGEIGGKTAVVFDGGDFLRTRAFTNSTPRNLYIYLVRQRDAYVQNAGLFAFVSSANLATANDDAVTGAALGYESSDKRVVFDYGNNTAYADTTGANGTPDIDFFFVGGCMACAGSLGPGNSVTNLTNLGTGGRAGDNDILRTTNNLFHIGSRLGAGDVMKTFLKGRIGEILVFEEPLNFSQEEELIPYLQKKWMGVGDGSATPPRWLAQPGTEVETGGRLAVRQAAGTELGQNGATVALASYTSEGAVAWTRDAALTNALFSVAGDMAFGGPVDLTLNPFPRKGYSRTLATYGGACNGFTSDWTCAGEGISGNPKVRHLSAEKRILLEFVSPTTVILLH